MFSVLYFALNIVYEQDDYENTTMSQSKIRTVIFYAIQLKNVTAFFSTTLFSIYMLKRNPEKAYPRLLEGKTHAYDFDMVMTSSISFSYFYDFVKS